MTNKPCRRKDGRFEVRLSIREDGRSKRLSVFGRTAKEAEAKAREIKTAIERGTFSRDRTTLSGYARAWLERKAKEVRPRTVQLYRQELAYALPSLKDPQAPDPLGSRKLQDVKPSHVREVLDALSERYSTRTVRMVRQRLWQVFRDAVDMEVAFRNPLDPVRVKAPRGGTKPRVGRALEPFEVAALLAALDQHKDPRTALLLRLLLACGLRLGEGLGLQWQDFDPEAGTLTIARAWSHNRLTEPKTATSERVVPVPHATLERLGLGPCRVHDLRHSYGSHLLANGAPLELESERLGHSSPNLTLSVYRHLLERERKGWLLDPEDLGGPRPQA